MATITLEGTVREKIGTGSAREARRAGLIPCTVYGDNKESTSILMSEQLLNKYVYKSNFFSTVFEINGVDKKGQKYVVKDVQYHPVTDVAVHLDFMRVGKGSRVSVRVPIHFINDNKSPGLKMGGVLNILSHEIDIVCDPENIPSEINIDLTGFEFHHTVHAKDVALPENVTLPTSIKNFTIATVVAPTIINKEESADAAPASDGAAES